MARDEPTPGAYRPFVAARYPGEGPPDVVPEWRVLVHRQHYDAWARIPEVCGESNTKELWAHLATQPNLPPRLGTVTPMRGGHNAATTDGMSRVFHYEVSGAGRVDYRYNDRYKTASDGDEHKVVQIISVDLGSH